MKKLLILCSIMLSFLTTHSYAAVQEFTVIAGQSTYIDVPVTGALTASSVSVSGSGVSARIHAKYAGKVRLKVTASNSAKSGLRDISLRLAMGTNKSSLYVFGLNKARINLRGSSIAGKLQQVEVDMPAIGGRLTATMKSNPRCYGNDGGRGIVYPGNYPVKRSSDKGTFWITSLDNSGNGKCYVTLTEYSTLTKQKYTRDITLDFDKDSRVPETLSRPTITTADRAISTTSSREGNSPELKWRGLRKANKYTLYYITGRGASRTTRDIETNRSWKKVMVNSTSTTLRNLRLGDYDYCVKAIHEPQNSHLRSITSSCSNIRSFHIRSSY